jgi:hypothetical protein
MNQVNKRIKDFIDYKGLNESSFSKMINIAQTTLNSAFMRDSDLKASVISDILSAFSDLSAEWLLRGKGEMINEATTSSSGSCAICASKDETISTQKKLIALLEKETRSWSAITKLYANAAT